MLRLFSGSGMVVLSCLLLLVSVKMFAQEKQQPNIIFIFADDWGYGDLGCYGATEVATPNLDKLAAKGTRYTQFHTTSGVCSPSRASVMTGKFPAENRVHGHFATEEKNIQRGMPNWLDETLPVYLPKMLQKAGYTTAHFGKWHLGGGGLPNGDTLAPQPIQYGYNEARVWNGNGPTWKGDEHFPTTRYMDDDSIWLHSSSRLAVDETIDFLERNQDKGKPVFVNLWLKDPHTPLWPTDEQRAPYKDFSEDKETYYAVLTDADHHVGRLLDWLEKKNLEENTLIIFSSDNGPAGWGPSKTAGSTGGRKGRKVDVFQGGVNVPFIAYQKGKTAAGKVDSASVLSAVDLLPTFCELANIELPKDFNPDGESFANIFNGEIFKRIKPLFWDWRFSRENSKSQWVSGAVRYGDWKLLTNKEVIRTELYNIVKDPFESNDLAEEEIEKKEMLLIMLEAWQKELPK